MTTCRVKLALSKLCVRVNWIDNNTTLSDTLCRNEMGASLRSLMSALAFRMRGGTVGRGFRKPALEIKFLS